ncbi:MAG: hypothetical protein WB347_20920, partial [Terriglobales bacterium]
MSLLKVGVEAARAVCDGNASATESHTEASATTQHAIRGDDHFRLCRLFNIRKMSSRCRGGPCGRPGVTF